MQLLATRVETGIEPALAGGYREVRAVCRRGIV
jgi:hypothetical protein